MLKGDLEAPEQLLVKRGGFNMARKQYNSSGISIVLGGEAGHGIQTIENIFTKVLYKDGFHVFATKEYMSRIRGGSNSTEIRISQNQGSAYVNKIDVLISFDGYAIKHLQSRLSQSTIIIGEEDKLNTEYPINNIEFSKISQGVGGAIYTNMVAVGVLCGILNVDKDILQEEISTYFAGKGQDVVDKNKEACIQGYAEGAKLRSLGNFRPNVLRDNNKGSNFLVSGTEAVSLGAIAGGCNFLSSYPMSPSTGVMINLANNADDFGIIVEQAEDEISAINMSLGASYAGACAMVTTSGGGFALMGEGLSLAGITETPIVIHLGQRPGPGTGLPTRTEQGDLFLALHSGHGEFPRIILAPSTAEDAFYLTAKAFALADKFQVPVIILTDQYFLDSYFTSPKFDLTGIDYKKHFVQTWPEYKRYQFTDTGISPRGVPGYGRGLVCADSDEHDEEGHITEDLNLRIKMVDKRLKKMKLIKQELEPPRFVGRSDYKVLMVGWGSSFLAIKEAMEIIGRKDLALLHCSQVYPLHEDIAKYMMGADKTIIIEGNATSQMGRLIRMETGLAFDHKIVKYSGAPFSVEELAMQIDEILKG